MNSMFDTLLQLPLFQGLTEDELTRILAKVKLHFNKYKSGEYICRAGDLCDNFIFLLKGEVISTATEPQGLYSISEYNQAPYVVEPQSLFGMSTTYTSTHVAHGEVHTVSIDKSFVFSELFNFDIFRLNYINILSNRAQQLNARLWQSSIGTPEQRISRFITSHSERPIGKKLLKIKMETLALLLNEGRVTISKALNDLQQRGLVELRRGEIFISEMGDLQ